MFCSVMLCWSVVITSFLNTADSTEEIQRHIWYSSFAFKEAATKLINRESVEVILVNNLSYEDLAGNDVRELWTFLYYAGYLTREDGSDGENSPYASLGGSKVYIPNGE